jgi:hypothetical protein
MVASAITLATLLKEVDQPAPLDKGILKINDQPDWAGKSRC